MNTLAELARHLPAIPAPANKPALYPRASLENTFKELSLRSFTALAITKKESRFLALPQELLDMIYKFALYNEDGASYSVDEHDVGHLCFPFESQSFALRSLRQAELYMTSLESSQANTVAGFTFQSIDYIMVNQLQFTCRRVRKDNRNLTVQVNDIELRTARSSPSLSSYHLPSNFISQYVPSSCKYLRVLTLDATFNLPDCWNLAAVSKEFPLIKFRLEEPHDFSKLLQCKGYLRNDYSFFAARLGNQQLQEYRRDLEQTVNQTVPSWWSDDMNSSWPGGYKTCKYYPMEEQGWTDWTNHFEFIELMGLESNEDRNEVTAMMLDWHENGI
jgi:hypothetical protein